MDELHQATAVVRQWFAGLTLEQVQSQIARSAPDHPVKQAIESICGGERQGHADATKALFGGIVEPLNDGFTPAGRHVSNAVMAGVLWRLIRERNDYEQLARRFGLVHERSLIERLEQLRDDARPLLTHTPQRILVLSRVTIGADVLITSIALQRLRQRFPAAELLLAGNPRLEALFGGMPGVRVVPQHYVRRGSLASRLESWPSLVALVDRERPDLVVGPDSRLDQLGLLPIVDDPDRYLLWENLIPNPGPSCGLAQLYDRWLVRRLGLPATPACVPTIALHSSAQALAASVKDVLGSRPRVAVKFDHGGNPDKALPSEAEALLLRTLRGKGWAILLDRGFGAEEFAASERCTEQLGCEVFDLLEAEFRLVDNRDGVRPDLAEDADVVRFEGSIGGWAAALSTCGLALSYDSAGQHLAAAGGVPLVAIMTGHHHDRFPIAWQPHGNGWIRTIIVPTAERDDPLWWKRIAQNLPQVTGSRL